MFGSDVDILASLSWRRYGWYTRLGASTGLMGWPCSPSTSEGQGVSARAWDGSTGSVDVTTGGIGAEMLLPMMLKGGSAATPSVSFLFLLCLTKSAVAATIAMTTAPPTVPPTMAPVLFDGPESFCCGTSDT